MKTFLLSVCALAVAATPVLGEDQDHPKPPKKNAPPQRQVNPAPRTFTPRVQSNVSANRQFQPRSRPTVTARTYTPPKSYTPEVQARLRSNSPRFTPADQDAPHPNINSKTTAANNTFQNRTRTNPNVVTPNPTVQSNTNWQNRNWQNRTNNNRNWRNNNTAGTFTFEQARRRFHRDRHDRSWWRSHFSRIVLFGGGYYYWDDGYWYPAYGYDPYYSTYTYDEPIYGYNDLAPGEVIANVQRALQDQGYYQDAVDGLIGPNTRAALSDFQRDRGLPITAAIDGPTLQALGLA
jgi:Putative peptidoglycan binding domain